MWRLLQVCVCERLCVCVTSCQARCVAHCTQRRRTSEQWQRRREPGRWDPPPHHNTAQSMPEHSPAWRERGEESVVWPQVLDLRTFLFEHNTQNDSPCVGCDSRPEQSAGEDQLQWNSTQTGFARDSPAHTMQRLHMHAHPYTADEHACLDFCNCHFHHARTNTNPLMRENTYRSLHTSTQTLVFA